MAVWNPSWLTNPQESVAFEQILMHRLRAMEQVQIGAQVLNDAHFDVFREIPDTLLVQLETRLLAERIQENVHMKAHPLTWRDHFKISHPRLVRWWSRWIWNLVIPEYEQAFYKITDWATYPFNSYIPPENKYLGRPVFYRQVDRITEEEFNEGGKDH